MSGIHEVATLTSKGQITLPKPIRQALGVSTGGKVAFRLYEGQVIVSRADEAHDDPVIAAFPGLVEADIRAGRSTGSLPPALVRSMLAQIGQPVDLEEEIEGDVAL